MRRNLHTLVAAARTQLLQDAIMRNRLANHVKKTWETILDRTPTQVKRGPYSACRVFFTGEVHAAEDRR